MELPIVPSEADHPSLPIYSTFVEQPLRAKDIAMDEKMGPGNTNGKEVEGRQKNNNNNQSASLELETANGRADEGQQTSTKGSKSNGK